MKLEAKNIFKTYNDTILINNFDYVFEEKTFYTISGSSGCGKTTLLNILSGLNKPDSGYITYDKANIYLLKEDDLRDLRLKNVGFVFQSFNLFEEDTVFNNIYLLNDTFSSLTTSMKRRKVNEALRVVGIERLKNKLVKNLSGGEKQRVAIARALVNNPSVIFADEPTGSLDANNAEKIFELLQKISTSCTVICVTHDDYLANTYSDINLKFDDGKIEERILNKNKNIGKINLMIERKKFKKFDISDAFLIQHFINNFKNHKFRFSLIFSLLVISFFATGLSISLKDSISESLNSVFKNMMNENSLILKRKNDDTGLIDFYSVEESEIENIKLKYSDDIEYFGVNYMVNFEQFFKDRNVLYNNARPLIKAIEGFNARSFNDFEVINHEQAKFPNLTSELKSDELVLALTIPAMKELCQYMQIERSYESLGKFIEEKSFPVDLYLENRDWGYFDDHLFSVKSVIPSKFNHICHTDPLFNKKLFEDALMFPSSSDLKRIEDYPWVLKKTYFLKTKVHQSRFLNKISYDTRYADYLFDSDGPDYSPISCSYEESPNTNKVYVYKVFKKDVPFYMVNNFKHINGNLNNYYFSTNGGYINLGTELFTGFSKDTYFSNSMENIDEIINMISRVNYNEIQKVDLPKNTLYGSALNLDDNNVKLTSSNVKISKGKKCETIEQVNVSSAFAEKVGLNINSTLFVSTIFNKELKEEYIDYHFRTVQLTVVGIFENDKCVISGINDFSISFFRDVMKISSFELIPNAIVYEFENKVSQDDINKLNSYYNDYIFIDPFANLDLGVNDTLSYLEYILMGLSLMTSISSTFLLIIVNYIQIQESKKDYAILVTLGFRNSEITKLTFYNVFIPCILAFVVSTLILFGSNFLISKVISSSLSVSTGVFFSSRAILFMIIVAVVVVFVSLEISKIPIKKMEIVKYLH